MTRQLPLALGADASHAREDLVIGTANAAALAWIDAWPDWRAPGLVLWGPEGSGKSHLASIWLRRAGARRVTIDTALATLDGVAEPKVLVEDVEIALTAGAMAEGHLLHAYNVVAQAQGSMLLTARRPPTRWPGTLPDLRSRMQALPAVAVQAPDDDMLAAVLTKLFIDRQLAPDPDVVSFIATRIERSFARLGQAVDSVDRAALAAHRAITLPFVRNVLRAEHLID
jgi:chromosomal replication initiation ATPase DnaA